MTETEEGYEIDRIVESSDDDEVFETVSLNGEGICPVCDSFEDCHCYDMPEMNCESAGGFRTVVNAAEETKTAIAFDFLKGLCQGQSEMFEDSMRILQDFQVVFPWGKREDPFDMENIPHEEKTLIDVLRCDETM